jgi:hypothetical protein
VWAPLPADPPPPGWWTQLEEQNLDAWLEGIESDLRAERIERLRALAHRTDMKAAGALQRDRWERIQRRHDERFARPYHGYRVDSWGAGPEVEHHPGGRVLRVR